MVPAEELPRHVEASVENPDNHSNRLCRSVELGWINR